jgi:hypothetical protein
MVATYSSQTSILTIAIRRDTPEDDILHTRTYFSSILIIYLCQLLNLTMPLNRSIAIRYTKSVYAITRKLRLTTVGDPPR